MGFDCILVDKHLFSFTFNDSEWLKLKRDYLDLGARAHKKLFK